MFVLPRVIGHRGAAASAPENTLAGLRAAAALGATWVEFDVMLTKDRVPVLFHDDNLKRITGQDALMAETSYAELVTLEAGSWFAPEFAGEPVPCLESALALVLELGLCLDLEIKPSAGRDVETAAVALEMLRGCWSRLRPAPLVSSYSLACLEVAQGQAPDFPRALNAFRLPRDWARQAARLDCVSVHLSDWRLSARTVARIKAAGYGVAAFTVNTPRRARKLVARGVDCIITNSPKLILDALG